MSLPRHHLAGLALTLICGAAAGAPQSFAIDPTHTFPAFEVDHLAFSKHRGRFNRTSGTVVLDRVAKRGEIELRVEAASIDTGHEALEKVLKSDSFFDAEKFPELRFASSQLDFEGERLVAVHGTLTMKGVSRPLSLRVDHFHCGRQLMRPGLICGANASGRLLRSEFGIDKYINFGIGDEVRLSIQVEAVAPDEAAPSTS